MLHLALLAIFIIDILVVAGFDIWLIGAANLFLRASFCSLISIGCVLAKALLQHTASLLCVLAQTPSNFERLVLVDTISLVAIFH